MKRYSINWPEQEYDEDAQGEWVRFEDIPDMHYAEGMSKALRVAKAELETIHDRHYDEQDCDEDASGHRTANRDMNTVVDCENAIRGIVAALATNPAVHAPGGTDGLAPPIARVRESATVGDSGTTDNALTVALQDALRNSNAALSLLSAYASDLDRQAINSQLAINYGVLARSPLLVRDVPRTVQQQEKT